MLVFVYGTLKRGGCRHHHLGSATFRGEGRTRDEFRLFDCGSYPGMIRSQPGVKVEGELWEIDVSRLPILDAEEGVAERLYERVTIPIRLADGTDQLATVYLYLRPIEGLRDLGTRWS